MFVVIVCSVRDARCCIIASKKLDCIVDAWFSNEQTNRAFFLVLPPEALSEAWTEFSERTCNNNVYVDADKRAPRALIPSLMPYNTTHAIR